MGKGSLINGDRRGKPPLARWVLGVLLVLLLATAPVAAQEPARGLFTAGPDSQVETIALTTAAGGPFESIGRYKVNAPGEVAFLASREGKLGLYFYTNGGLVVVLKEGQPIPGDPQLSFVRDEDHGFTFELSDGGGVVLVGASLTDDLNGVFLYSDSSLETIMRAGQVGHDGAVLESVTPLRYTSDGRVLFLGETLIDTSAVYSYDPSARSFSTPLTSSMRLPGNEAPLRTIVIYKGLVNKAGDLVLDRGTTQAALFSGGELFAVPKQSEDLRGMTLVLTDAGGLFLARQQDIWYFDGSYQQLISFTFSFLGVLKFGAKNPNALLRNSFFFGSSAPSGPADDRLWLASASGVDLVLTRRDPLPDPFESLYIGN